MVTIWIHNVESPEQINEGDYINVNVKIRYTTWPWWLGGGIINMISNLRKDGNQIQEIDDPFKPWWFWGSKTHYYIITDIVEDSIFQVEVGYSD